MRAQVFVFTFRLNYFPAWGEGGPHRHDLPPLPVFFFVLVVKLFFGSWERGVRFARAEPRVHLDFVHIMTDPFLYYIGIIDPKRNEGNFLVTQTAPPAPLESRSSARALPRARGSSCLVSANSPTT